MPQRIADFYRRCFTRRRSLVRVQQSPPRKFLISLKSGCFYNFLDAFFRTREGCTTKIRQFCEYRRKNTEEKPLRFLFCIRIGPVFQQSLTQRLGAGVVVDLRQHLQVTVSQQACHHVRVDALGDPERGAGMPQFVGRQLRNIRMLQMKAMHEGPEYAV